MNTEKPPLDWTKPLQSTDGYKDVKLLHILKDGSTYPVMTVIGDSYHTFTMEGRENRYSQTCIQLINTPETKLVEFSVGNCTHGCTVLIHKSATCASNINRIDFSMQLEPGKNYEVTGVKEVQ